MNLSTNSPNMSHKCYKAKMKVMNMIYKVVTCEHEVQIQQHNFTAAVKQTKNPVGVLAL